MPTRRDFIRNCSLAAATATLIPTSLLARNPASTGDGLTSPGLVQYKSQLNTTFTIQTGGKVARLKLVEAQELPVTMPTALDARNERFSLLFRGPLAVALNQDTYSLVHPELGTQLIFIVPIRGKDAGQQYYEAIFNRPLQAEDLARQLALAPRGEHARQKDRQQTC